MRSILLRMLTAASIAALGLVITAPTALAHETRKVGPYEFVAGWGDEPNFTGFKNSVQLLLSDAKTGEPVNELAGTVTVEVGFGDETTSLEMEPAFLPGVFGEEGDYRAYLVPSRSGEYTFTFTGSINGMDIDETFTCGEETFDCAADQQEIQFPEQDPSNGELAERLDRELPRLEAASATEDDLDDARMIGYIGLGLGALALILSLVSFMRGGATR